MIIRGIMENLESNKSDSTSGFKFPYKRENTTILDEEKDLEREMQEEYVHFLFQ